MPTQKVIGSKTFTVPTSNDTGWGVTTTAYLLELGTYANQVAIASYDLTKNFKVNSTSTTADSKTVAQYGLESTFIAFKNYSASSSKFGAIRLPEFGPAGSDNTYTETSSTGSSLGTFVSHNQINWKLAGGYFYLHANNPATYSDAALVVQKLNTTNSPINNQTALTTAVADTSNLNVDTVVLAKTAATLRNKSINVAAASGNVITNSDVTNKAAIFDGSTLGPSTVTKAELATLSGISTGSTVQTRLAALESSSTSVAGDIGNIGAIAGGIIVKTTNSGTDVYASRTVTGTANKIVVTNGDGVSGNPTLDIGTDVATLTDTQTLQNKTINTNINTIKGTASTMASFNGSGDMVTTNAAPDDITFSTGKGIESTSAASSLNIGTTNNTTTLNLGTSASTSTVNIGTGAGVTTINIGGSGDTVNIAGTLVNVNTTNMDVVDQTVTVNKGGTAANTAGAGISIEGGGSEVGYLRSDSARTGTEFKSEQRAGTTDIRHSTASATNVLDLTSSNGNTYSYPATTGNVVIDTAAQTLRNKTVNNLLYLAESATVATANLAPTSTPPKSIQRITSSTATLGTITNTGGAFNTELILMNVSGSAISVLNDSGASSTSIITGTGAPISLADKASIIVIYDAVASRWRVVGGSGSGSGGGSAVTNNVNQTTHGFVAGDWLYLNGTTYTKAINTSEAASQAVGVVTTVIDTNNFTITTSGVATGLSGLTAGAVHYVSSTAGAITATKPFITTQFEAPVGIAISTTSMYVSCDIAQPASRNNSVNQNPVRNYLQAYADSSVNLGTVTNSLGDTLSSSDRTANKTTWGSSNTSLLTIARSTDSTLRGSFNYLITEAGSSSGAFIESPLFTLDQVDIGKPVSVSFDVNGNAADGDYQAYIVRYNSSNVLQSRVVIAGNASTTSPNSAKLPTGTTTFNGFFVPDSTTTTDQYALRIVSNNSSAASIRIDTLFIGPQPIRVGAAITDWQSYTPTGAATNATYTGRWRRAGDSIECLIDLAFTASPGGASIYYFTFAQALNGLGLTVDTSKLPNTTDVALSVGTYTVLDSGTAVYSGLVSSDGSGVQCWSPTGVQFSASSPIAVMVSGDNLSLNFKLPITGWSSNVTMADRAVESYAADDGSSDVFGPNGALVPNVAAGTGTTTRDFTFPETRQVTDAYILEVNISGNGWSALNGNVGRIVGTASYVFGMWGYWTSATNYRVEFGNGGSVMQAGLAANGYAWASEYTNGTRFRLRRVSAGAQVGYPIDVSNLVNNTPSQLQWSGQNGYGSTNTVIRRFTTMTAAIGSNITAADSATLGASFTVNKTGMYSITYCDALTAGGNIGLSRNSAQLTTNIASITAANRLAIASPTANDVFACVSGVFYLTAGDVIRCHTDGSGATTSVARTSFYMVHVTT